MEYLVGVVVLGAVLFILKVTSSVGRFNKLCLLSFPNWISIYSSSEMPEKFGIARAFLLQTLHLAEKTGAVNASEKNEIDKVLRAENPIGIVDDWLEHLLPSVIDVCGENNLAEVDARGVGVFMLLVGAKSRSGLLMHLQRFQ